MWTPVPYIKRTNTNNQFYRRYEDAFVNHFQTSFKQQRKLNPTFKGKNCASAAVEAVYYLTTANATSEGLPNLNNSLLTKQQHEKEITDANGTLIRCAYETKLPSHLQLESAEDQELVCELNNSWIKQNLNMEIRNADLQGYYGFTEDESQALLQTEEQDDDVCWVPTATIITTDLMKTNVDHQREKLLELFRGHGVIPDANDENIMFGRCVLKQRKKQIAHLIATVRKGNAIMHIDLSNSTKKNKLAVCSSNLADLFSSRSLKALSYVNSLSFFLSLFQVLLYYKIYVNRYHSIHFQHVLKLEISCCYLHYKLIITNTFHWYMKI